MDKSLFSTLDEAAISELAKKEADAIIQRECIDIFESVVQKKVPHMTISSEHMFVTWVFLPQPNHYNLYSKEGI